MQLDNTELETSPLIEELKRRTEVNKEKNTAEVKAMTQLKASVYDPELRMVRYDGVTRMLTPEQIKELNVLGYDLSCPGSGMACGLKVRPAPPPPLPPPPPPVAEEAALGSGLSSDTD